MITSKIFVHTKKMPNEDWSTHTTLNGYDHAFVGEQKEDVVEKMSELLKNRNVEAIWTAEVIHDPKVFIPTREYPRLKLDNL